MIDEFRGYVTVFDPRVLLHAKVRENWSGNESCTFRHANQSKRACKVQVVNKNIIPIDDWQERLILYSKKLCFRRCCSAGDVTAALCAFSPKKILNHKEQRVLRDTMAQCRSSVILRLTTLLLSCLLLRDIRSLDRVLRSWVFNFERWRHLSSSLKLTSKSANYLPWSAVDLESPPKLRFSIAEGIRFNELLARVQYPCSKKSHMGTALNGFASCQDSFLASKQKNVLAILGDPYDEGSFETSLAADKYFIFTPRESAWMKEINSQVVLVSALRESGWQLPRILASVPHKTFDSVKVDFVSPYLADGGFVQAASLVQELLEKISTDQLHLVVRIRREDAHDTLFAWYSLLHWLFFKRSFVLFSAEQSGLCGRQIDQCRYQLSYLRLPRGGMIPFEAPIFGMSSPTEEHARLLTYLESTNEDCSVSSTRTDIPLFCTEFLRENPCHVYMFRYPNDDNSLVSSASASTSQGQSSTLDQCKVFYFAPGSSANSSGGFDFAGFEITERVGLSPDKSQKTVPGGIWGDWTLTPLAKLTARYSPDVQRIISLLTLDLDGGEWDILGGLLDSGVLKRFRQISFRIRIWFGEENENYRRFYSWFIRLERQGFHKLAFRQLQESVRDIVFVSL